MTNIGVCMNMTAEMPHLVPCCKAASCQPYQVRLQLLVCGCVCWVTGGTEDSDCESIYPSFICVCKHGATACVSQA